MGFNNHYLSFKTLKDQAFKKGAYTQILTYWKVLSLLQVYTFPTTEKDHLYFYFIEIYTELYSGKTHFQIKGGGLVQGVTKLIKKFSP